MNVNNAPVSITRKTPLISDKIDLMNPLYNPKDMDNIIITIFIKSNILNSIISKGSEFICAKDNKNIWNCQI